MGHVGAALLPPAAIELPLPWGPIIRGVRWGAGPSSVLLLHEPGTDIDAWGALPGQLARSLRVQAVAVDLPGHGLSDDPWEPEKMGSLVRILVRECSSLPPPALTPLPPSPIAMGEGEGSIGGRQFIVAAGPSATEALWLAADLRLAGLVVLSPTGYEWLKPEPPAQVPPSPIAMGEGRRGVRATVPKLFIAGSLAYDDLENARRLAGASSGWTVVTSIPTSERGTGLLATPWRTRLGEEITAFLRDCQRPKQRFTGKPGVAPGSPA